MKTNRETNNINLPTQTGFKVPVIGVAAMPPWRQLPVAKFLLIVLLAPALTGCGLTGMFSEPPHVAESKRVADYQAVSLENLSESLPPTDPRKIGVEKLTYSAEVVSETLGKPEPAERIPAENFATAVQAHETAKAQALAAGRSEAEAEALGAAAAGTASQGNSGAVTAALDSLKRSPPPSGGSFIGQITGVLQGGLSLLGPWGAAAGMAIGAIGTIIQSSRRRKVQKNFNAMVHGVENAKNVISGVIADKGALGTLTDGDVRKAINGALQDSQLVWGDVKTIAEEVAKLKAKRKAKDI